MANHSAEFPEGFLSGEVLKSMYAITNASDGTLQYTPGHERIPANWYCRSFLAEYTFPLIIADLVTMWARYPQLLAIGGNINGVNTYAPIDIANLTGGVYNAETLLQGNNAACFAFQAMQLLVPDALSGLANFVHIVVTKVLAATGPILEQLNCPELNTHDASIFEQYPGYRRTNHAV